MDSTELSTGSSRSQAPHILHARDLPNQINQTLFPPPRWKRLNIGLAINFQSRIRPTPQARLHRYTPPPHFFSPPTLPFSTPLLSLSAPLFFYFFHTLCLCQSLLFSSDPSLPTLSPFFSPPTLPFSTPPFSIHSPLLLFFHTLCLYQSSSSSPIPLYPLLLSFLLPRFPSLRPHFYIHSLFFYSSIPYVCISPLSLLRSLSTHSLSLFSLLPRFPSLLPPSLYPLPSSSVLPYPMFVSVVFPFSDPSLPTLSPFFLSSHASLLYSLLSLSTPLFFHFFLCPMFDSQSAHAATPLLLSLLFTHHSSLSSSTYTCTLLNYSVFPSPVTLPSVPLLPLYSINTSFYHYKCPVSHPLEYPSLPSHPPPCPLHPSVAYNSSPGFPSSLPHLTSYLPFPHSQFILIFPPPLSPTTTLSAHPSFPPSIYAFITTPSLNLQPLFPFFRPFPPTTCSHPLPFSRLTVIIPSLNRHIQNPTSYHWLRLHDSSLVYVITQANVTRLRLRSKSVNL
ncbi:hypothetical protein C7M84_017832 [Penaeus vannamei]|uniref:Uncharacterized protein n=1 Tax=Penaeus vannamei TaxID=6689 RepID=A0A3R7LVJ0_PENVA|nr:hypothetical protein C7M84_017832 [Penaeus vannamei]